MLRYIITTMAFVLSVTTVSFSQNDTIPASQELRDLVLGEHLWLHSKNVAGLSRSAVYTGGTTALSYEYDKGGYHRAQEGYKKTSFQFRSDRYDSLGKYLVVHGVFKFNMGSEYERAWSDMIETYNYQPFIYGSPRKGSYDRQDFDLHAKLSTVELGSWTFGAGLDYVASDMTRIVDPRPRIQYARYGITPSLTYKLANEHVLGLSGSYHFRKEKPKNFKIINTEADYDYVFYSGLENAKIIKNATGGFKREFTSDIVSAELQYQYALSHFKTLLTLGYFYEDQKISAPLNESPGCFKQEGYNLGLHSSLSSPSMLHTLSAGWSKRKGNADEYIQELEKVTDPNTGLVKDEWKTIFTFNSRYQIEVNNTDLHYKLYYKGNNQNGYKAQLSFNAAYSSFVNKHHLQESSLAVKALDLSLGGGYKVFSKNIGQTLWVNGLGMYHKPTSVKMSLADPTSPVAVNVLSPDKKFYESSYYGATLDVTYNHPIALKKSSLTAFIKLYGSYLKSNDFGRRGLVGLSIGILTK